MCKLLCANLTYTDEWKLITRKISLSRITKKYDIIYYTHELSSLDIKLMIYII